MSALLTPEHEWLTPAEAADKLRISRTQLLALIGASDVEHRLKTLDVGRQLTPGRTPGLACDCCGKVAALVAVGWGDAICNDCL